MKKKTTHIVNTFCICIADREKCQAKKNIEFISAANCPYGYIGKYCEKQCSFPKYGYGCQRSCFCTKSQCHFATGCKFKQNGKLLIWEKKRIPWVFLFAHSNFTKIRESDNKH